MAIGQVDNQRQFTRLDLQIATELRSADGICIVGESSDISLEGFFLQCEGSFPEGSLCEITLVLGRESENESLKISGRIARVKAAGMAVQFNEQLSESNVRRLIAYWNPAGEAYGGEG